MSFPKSFKTVEIMQQCTYGFTLDYVAKLCSEWSVIKDYAYILHDKDEKEDGSYKEAHIHLMLRFNDSVPTTAILAKLSGVCEVQHLQKMKSWKSAVAYLTHANATDKYQYPEDMVYSNFDWQAVRDEALNNKRITREREEEIINGIVTGSIPVTKVTDEQYIKTHEYVALKRKIDIAVGLRFDRVRKEKRQMEVIFLSGPSGVGKTSYAKAIASGREYDYYIASGGDNPFDDYQGEECIILDDFRGSSMKFQDLLKLLDNHTASSVAARYKNKNLAFCKMIIITSTVPIDSFYGSLFKEHDEDKIQFFRRISTYAVMDMDFVYIYTYNPISRKYEQLRFDSGEFVVMDNLYSTKARKQSADEYAEKMVDTFMRANRFARQELGKKE